jgi:O-antigen ligase
MNFIAALFAVPLIIWGCLWVARGSVILGVALYLVAASAIGSQFASFDIGITMSIDRMMLLALVVGFAARLTFFSDGVKSTETKLTVAEYWMMGFIGILLCSTFFHDWQRDAADQVPILQHLIEGYLLPTVLYWMAKRSKFTEKSANQLLVVFGLFGIYLALTAIFEVAGMWSLVYPKYIADPTLGIHFGRARGPFLQSVRLGMYLLIGLGAVWVPLVSRGIWGRGGRLLGFGLAMLFLIATYVTYTRSVWLGLVLSGTILVVMTFERSWRRLTLVVLSFCLVMGLFIGSTDLISFDRGIGAEATSESTSMRAVFAYVSWLMFQDAPLTGCGFGHFPHLKDAYLGDRASALQLETIRGFIHHNTFLSLLVELGIFGLISMLAFLGSLLLEARRLWQQKQAPQWMREQGLLFVLFTATFALQMLFHEVSYSPIEFGLLFFLAGLMSNAAAAASATERSTEPSKQTQSSAVWSGSTAHPSV